ncbi:MAG TPA: methylaspartate mutase [Firmicutes bacterium]|nr:methylaspartate mutase [Candidatus Fermentithermobacillaceae bacterium]
MKELYLITDVGSTTTKAILIGEKAGEHRLIGRGEHPTTVEAPYEDVTIGVLGALRDLGSRTGRAFLSETGILKEQANSRLKYLSTSSAGGGLQMMVFGVMRNVTADSARKAALGGGAIVLDVMTIDDDRPSFLKLDAIRAARPDMVLIAGGLDGGNTAFALEICDLLCAARPRPRLGKDFRIPVIYAGNKDAAPLVVDTLSDVFDVKVVDNLRPSFDKEVLEPVRRAIHELFMSHVMSHAPGYDRLLSWVDVEVMPTPMAVGRIMEHLAAARGMNILGVDIGGATTDVFSVISGVFHRSVSANLGMSYSSGNVLLEAGIENILRWLPFEASPDDIADRICTKLINPTTLPSTVTDLQIEHALATEALRLAFDRHKEVATVPPKDLPAWKSLMGQTQVVVAQPETRTILDIGSIDMIIGSGGVLSHAPSRAQAALIMLNAFCPTGVTYLAVDSIFMMPHLGVLAEIDPEAALNVLEKDCFIPLGPVVAVDGAPPLGAPVVTVRCRDSQGVTSEATVRGGSIHVIPTPWPGEVTVEAEVQGPVSIAGQSRVQLKCRAGQVGVIVDARGRPLTLPEDRTACAAANAQWLDQISSSK